MTKNEYFAEVFNSILDEIKDELSQFSFMSEDVFGDPENIKTIKIFSKMLTVANEFRDGVIEGKKDTIIADQFYENLDMIKKKELRMQIKTNLN